MKWKLRKCHTSVSVVCKENKHRVTNNNQIYILHVIYINEIVNYDDKMTDKNTTLSERFQYQINTHSSTEVAGLQRCSMC